MSIIINENQHIGYIAEDVELDHTPKGTAAVTLRIGVPRPDRDADPVWIDYRAYGPLAEFCAEKFGPGKGKGYEVLCKGRTDYATWTNDQDQKRSKVDFVANVVIPLESKQARDAARAEREAAQAQEPAAEAA